jgi:RNA polymerase sigma-70 factor, ECF subfamily
LGDVSRIRAIQDDVVASALSTLASQPSGPPGGSVADAAFAPSPASELADEALLALISRGDTRAFEIMYERHCGPAFSLASRLCPDRATAEEITQDAFLALWRTAGSYDASRGSCRTWILAIVRYRAIDALRRGGRHARQRAGDEGLEERLQAPLSTEGEITRREQRKEVQDALRELPVAQRRVIELAYFRGLSQTEIASLLGDPLGTVKGRTRLALTRLRPLFDGTARPDA